MHCCTVWLSALRHVNQAGLDIRRSPHQLHQSARCPGFGTDSGHIRLHTPNCMQLIALAHLSPHIRAAVDAKFLADIPLGVMVHYGPIILSNDELQLGVHAHPCDSTGRWLALSRHLD